MIQCGGGEKENVVQQAMRNRGLPELLLWFQIFT